MSMLQQEDLLQPFIQEKMYNLNFLFAFLIIQENPFKGMEEADSVTIDPHKYLLQPFGMGCLLVKEGEDLYKSYKLGENNFWV